MNYVRLSSFYFILFVLFISPVFAQQTTYDSTKIVADSGKSAWSFAADAYYYIVPGEKNTSTVLGYADYHALHFEGRYNYEGQNTGSVFVGYRLEAGNKLAFGVTPMFGYVFGDLNGVIPALKLDLTWKIFDFYSESEYVIITSGRRNNYFYTWTELAVTPFNNFRTGISANRTRLYNFPLDVQRGIFVQYSFWKLTAGFHYFNPFDAPDSFSIATLGIEF